MSIQRRRPLVSFESSDRANIVSDTPSMTKQRRRKQTTTKSRKRRTRPSQAVRVVKGKVNIKLPGSKTLKVAPSKLITFVSKQQLKQAARHLVNKGPVRRRVKKVKRNRK